ncbi:MAG TPA: NDP-sugar synthase [Phycisphaerae bacterium]|nr:NDP-sugar synthase [Phycisphaerales bacterium]HRX86282.1 NDP-sugar synthase [Phycisphaerae bacterium]
MLEEAAALGATGAPDVAAEHIGETVNTRGVTVRGIVLAGVHAWGDCQLEQTVCRPLMPVAARPLITHALSWIRDSGIHKATICANSDTAALYRRLGGGESLGIQLDYFEDVMPRGPAGCVRDAAWQQQDAELLVVVDGTMIPRVDLHDLIDRHVATQAAVTLVVNETSAGHEPVGIYVFTRAVLNDVPATGYQDIKESLIPALYRRGARVVPYSAGKAPSVRVTDAASYLGVNMWATERGFGENRLPDGGKRIGDAWVDASAHVDPTARFVGPVIVGPNAWIGPDVLVIGPSTIGAGARVSAGAVVSRSAVWDRCVVGANTNVDQCVLAEGTKLDPNLVVRETVCLTPRRRRKWLSRVSGWLGSRAQADQN